MPGKILSQHVAACLRSRSDFASR